MVGAVLLFCALSPALRFAQQAPPSTLSVEAATYLAEALATMREVSFHRDTVDWARVRRDAFAAAAGAEVAADTYEALRGALLALGDHHSFLQLPPELAQLESERRALRPAHAPPRATAESPGARSRFVMRRKAEGHLHETAAGAIARVVVPLFTGADKDGFARELQGHVAQLDEKRPIGWIIDLRGNGGGNMWPMLAGVGPILGEGRAGAFLGLEGISGHWYYRAGRAGVEREDGESLWIAATVDVPHVLAEPPPVVVLIDDGTASSGEAVAIAFQGRPRTRFIGKPTFGLSSSNQGFPLQDGANLVITVGLDVDRTGKSYADKVIPDEDVDGPAGASDEDPQLARAFDWLLGQ